MDVTKVLVDEIGHRQVSTPGEEEAAQYLLGLGKELQAYAKRNRPDLDLVVQREQVSGAIGLQEVFGLEIANAYNNLTNVIIRIAPKSLGSGVLYERVAKTLLVNAHYDSTLGSHGASDCASCVGVGFEIARTLVYNESLQLHSPVLFLFNGGEETLMQAAHGFMSTSKYAGELGAFINIESTGPWGPDVLFQHTNDWSLKAYKRAVPHPRGNSMAQDFFELGVIPADTDYRMFSYRNYGSLPGIDVAFLFDGLAYHTSKDEVERIRRGTLQSMGENVMACVLEFSKVLGVPGYKEEMYGDQMRTKSQGQVFFDFFGKFMVVYGPQMASLLHNIPLVALLSLSMARGAGRGVSAIPDPSQMTRSLARPALACLSALTFPAILGVSRAWLSGRSLSWYGNFFEACCLYLPMAMVGLLVPLRQNDAYECLGFGVIFSCIASLFALAKMSSGYLSASWGTGTLIAALVNGFSGPSLIGHVLALIALFVPAYLNGGIALTTFLHILEKIGLTGSADGLVGRVLTDGVVGSLSGLCIILTFGPLSPQLSTAFGKYKRMMCIMLTSMSVGTAYLSSFYAMPRSIPDAIQKKPHELLVRKTTPYSSIAPKRVIIQHIHKTGMDGMIEYSLFSACSLDAVKVDESGALPPRLEELPSLPFSSDDWISLYPVNKLVSGVCRNDTKRIKKMHEIENIWPRSPQIRLVGGYVQLLDDARHLLMLGFDAVKEKLLPDSQYNRASRQKRIHFELDTVLPGWAVLNITGIISSWSLGPRIAQVPESNLYHIVRYSSGPHTTKWRLWIDVPENHSNGQIDLYVKHLKLAPYAIEILDGIPDWVSTGTLTAWQSTIYF